MQFDREQLNQELLNNYNKDKDNEYNESGSGLSAKSKMVLFVVSFLIVTICLILLMLNRINNKEYEIPLIKSDIAEQFRFKPADPGGEYIPNKDKMIYNTIADKKNKQEPQLVKLMPKAEEPIDRSVLNKSATPTESKNTKTAKAALDKTKPADNKVLAKTAQDSNLKQQEKRDTDIVPKLKNLKDSATVVNEKTVTTKTVTAKPKPKIAKQTNPKVTAKEDIKKQVTLNKDEINDAFNKITIDDLIKNSDEKLSEEKKQVISKVSNGKSYKIQLASFRTPSDAGEQWVSLKKKYPEQLEGLKLNIEKVDLGNKGIFYRLRPNGIDTIMKARKICDKLRDKNQGCLVVSD